MLEQYNQYAMATSSNVSARCTASTFTSSPQVLRVTPGVAVTDITADLVTDFSGEAPWYYNWNQPNQTVSGATFCNVTVSYEHTGQGDGPINVRAYLPVATPAWNGRLMAVGGGGWFAGMFETSFYQMIGALSAGYATVTTDAGLATPNTNTSATTTAADPGSTLIPWSLVSEGNVNLYALQNLGTVSLRDQGLLAKALIRAFYGGDGPRYSYFSGCSQGGRQGLQVAQRYPDLYDGIAAASPGMYWAQMAAALYWPHVVTNALLNGTAPADCEVHTLTALAVAACDPLDGVVDGVVADVAACEAAFNAFAHVGAPAANCSDSNATTTISREAAVYANATWTGPRAADGRFLWYGPNVGAPILDDNSKNVQVLVGGEWIRRFVAKNTSFNLDAITVQDFEWLFHSSVAEFDSMIGASDGDLREFQRHNGKMVTYHGLADEILATKATEKYWDTVSQTTGQADDYYRLFVVPGLDHCAGGTGGQPTAMFEALTNWVENGTAPDSVPISFTDSRGVSNERILCPYPQRAVWNGVGDPTIASSFSCAEK